MKPQNFKYLWCNNSFCFIFIIILLLLLFIIIIIYLLLFLYIHLFLCNLKLLMEIKRNFGKPERTKPRVDV